MRNFQESEYEGETLRIGKMLQDKGYLSSRKDIRQRERNNLKLFLEDKLLWKESKKVSGLRVRVVGSKEQKEQIMTEFHESDWAGHRGTWATFTKIKQKY
mgnify:CR=1 FL=1